jgi:hypothetical protein
LLDLLLLLDLLGQLLLALLVVLDLLKVLQQLVV